MVFAESIIDSEPVSADPTTSSTTYKMQQAAREYHLKAAFLRYVAKFVEWPSESMQEGFINICVLGQIPYYKGIESIQGKIVNDRELKVIKVLDADDAQKDKQCQILFIAKTESEKVDKIIKEIKTKPILGFGDMDGYAEKGGEMNFYIMNNRLAIMINPPAVEMSKLRINPRMLKLVTIVPPINQNTFNE